MTGLLCALLGLAQAGERLAVVVGSNTAIRQRGALRYAHRDADNIAAALYDLGDFDGVKVMYDPHPDEVVRALDQYLARAGDAGDDSLVLFYYSGHADKEALYPAGQALSVADLKLRLDQEDQAAVRLGVVDACSGGGWTGAKGLTPTPVFDVEIPEGLDSQGMALIASSSGSELAHEAEVIEGSFFTHHLVAGLRGAADQDQNGQVSLREAFEHAQRGTVQAAAIYAEQTQTPSFDLQLRGKQDLVLTRLDRAPSILTLHQEGGAVEVVHLDTGVVVLRLEAGVREVELALPPGGYVVRRKDASGANHATQVDLGIGQRLSLAESQLSLVLEPDLASKSAQTKRPRPDPMNPMLARGGVRLRVTIGDENWLDYPVVAYGLSDRVTFVSALMLAAQVSSPGARNTVLLWGGNRNYTEVSPALGIDRVRSRQNGSSGLHLFGWARLDRPSGPLFFPSVPYQQFNLAVTRTVRWGEFLRIDIPFGVSVTRLPNFPADEATEAIFGMGEVLRAGEKVALLNLDFNDYVTLLVAPSITQRIELRGSVPRRYGLSLGIEGRL